LLVGEKMLDWTINVPRSFDRVETSTELNYLNKQISGKRAKGFGKNGLKYFGTI
jgi:hypothetical protein